MYFVNHSVNIEGGLRERKRAATRAAITAAARSLTAEHGLNGYTVEQVCEQTGISRRTFFNYFPAKEDAIIGHVDDDLPAAAAGRFIAGGAGSPRGAISPSLLSDLVQLSLDLSEQTKASEAETRQLIAVIEKEPQLMLRIIGASEQRDAQFAQMLAEREHVPKDHPVVRMAVLLLGSIARKTGAAYFSEDNTRPYRDMLLENVAAARTLFCQPLDTTPPVSTEGLQ
ncbi:MULTISPECIES: TetR/AcrR family transcriptional regulator [unclassified Arthrobacter]|uniref:TetR/AcrR family transcriptional regulator n=1 Tax=unclassified Arthrobacter TaxID=235627 RepID=UPI002E061E10|nr:AcrR family transcriptional regulator [Arthrobacter sp. MP_M4]MEC5202706.1 AcrR family transcriptional regulator [Arthrobacter sp. MP_M7]